MRHKDQMPMSSPYVIVLSDAEEAALSARARSGRGAYRGRLRAQIVLAAAAGRSNAGIADELGGARTRPQVAPPVRRRPAGRPEGRSA
jgi:hypothetical protein